MNRSALNRLTFLALIVGAVSGCDQGKQIKKWLLMGLPSVESNDQAAEKNAAQGTVGVAARNERESRNQHAGQEESTPVISEPDLFSDVVGDDQTAWIQRMFVESIKVAQQVADGIADVNDEASAMRAASTIGPLIERRKVLTNELAAFRIEMGEAEFAKVRQPYRDRFVQSNRRAVEAEAKLLLNPSLSVVWAKALILQAGKPNQPSPRESALDIDAIVDNSLRQGDLAMKLLELVTAARDDGDVSEYEGQIREILPEYQGTLRKLIADNLRMTRPQSEEVHRRTKDHPAMGGKLNDEMKRILKSSMAGEMRTILREIFQHQLDALPESTAKRKTKAKWDKAGLL